MSDYATGEEHNFVVDEHDEIAVATALLGEIERNLAAIARAITRIEDGSYGGCEICGAQLDPSVLALSPETARCVEHEDTLESLSDSRVSSSTKTTS